MASELGKNIVIFSLVIFLGGSSLAFADRSTESQYSTKQTPLHDDNPIELDLGQTKLSRALKVVNERSGVIFRVKDGLGDQIINKKISGNDWNFAIKQMLQGYSYLGIVDRTKSFRRVIITGLSGNGVDPSGRLEEGLNPGEDAPDGQLSESPILLWQTIHDPGVKGQKKSEIPTEFIQTNPNALKQIRVGQPLEIQIPQEEFPLFGVVGDAHSELNGRISVWSGPLDAFHETASFTVTQGKKLTLVTVATGLSIYEISIDNATGLGTVVNGLDLIKGKDGNDTVIPPIGVPGA